MWTCRDEDGDRMFLRKVSTLLQIHMLLLSGIPTSSSSPLWETHLLKPLTRRVSWHQVVQLSITHTTQYYKTYFGVTNRSSGSRLVQAPHLEHLAHYRLRCKLRWRYDVLITWSEHCKRRMRRNRSGCKALQLLPSSKQIRHVLWGTN